MTILPSVNMFQPWPEAFCWIQPLWMRPIWALFQIASTWQRTFGTCAFVASGTAEISCWHLLRFCHRGPRCSLTYLWMNAPYTYHQALGDLADSVNLQRILSSGFQELGTFEISTVARTERISSFWLFWGWELAGNHNGKDLPASPK